MQQQTLTGREIYVVVSQQLRDNICVCLNHHIGDRDCMYAKPWGDDAIATTSITAVCMHIFTQVTMLLYAMLLYSNTKL